MSNGRREADRIQHGPAADYNYVAPPIEPRRLEGLQHPLQNAGVVLERLAPGHDFGITRLDQMPGVPPAERFEPPGQIWPAANDATIDPKLNLDRTRAGALQDIGQHILFGAKNVAREPEPMNERNREGNVDSVKRIGLYHRRWFFMRSARQFRQVISAYGIGVWIARGSCSG